MMSRAIKPVLVLASCAVALPVAAQNCPTHGGPHVKIELREILENAGLQHDPAVQKHIDQLREMLAPNALSKEEADALFSKIINSKGTTNGH